MSGSNFDFSKSEDFNLNQNEAKKFGNITEFERLKAAKQILFGLAFLYILTLVAYVYIPEKGNDLIEIAKMVFPPLATLIIAFYFRDNRSQ